MVIGDDFDRPYRVGSVRDYLLIIQGRYVSTDYTFDLASLRLHANTEWIARAYQHVEEGYADIRPLLTIMSGRSDRNHHTLRLRS